MKYKITLLIASLFLSQTIFSQTYVDSCGVWKWKENNKELALYGINYTAPFAHSYRAHKQLGIDPKESIDKDVYHFARLGLDAYRVHVWNCEITDEKGNLIQNEHLELFDYLLFKLKERGIKIALTPMIHFGNGYPDPSEKRNSFNEKYTIHEIFTDANAIAAQQNYLKQFLNHVNPYTKKSYKEDNDIVAIEILNEPNPELKKDNSYITAYLNKMIAAVRSTSCNKPLFYNVTRNKAFLNPICKAPIQGTSFQWYPTGLVAKHEIEGNFLYNTDTYNIPFTENPSFANKARMVYEFDAADTSKSFMYPAMARSFRGAGFQWATQFSYDSFGTAAYNTEYHTHYLNLTYTPKKAISMRIASEIFHKLPLNKNYGVYPENKKFDAFRIDEKTDLAEMVNDIKFIYTNSTKSLPPSPKRLKQIAGCGNSTIVKYEGTGAYFLDKVKKGVWRLEVMPDVFHVKDAYRRNNLEEKVAVIKWENRSMKVNIPELGAAFKIKGINKGNSYQTEAKQQNFKITPGTYFLYTVTEKNLPSTNQQLGNIFLDEFQAPKASVDAIYVNHKPLVDSEENKTIVVTAEVISPRTPSNVYIQIGRRSEKIPLIHQKGYNFKALIPSEFVKQGYLNYHIVVKDKEQLKTFPSQANQLPSDWDFISNKTYQTRIVKKQTPIVLFSGEECIQRLVIPHMEDGIVFKYEVKPTENSGNYAFYIWADSLNQDRHVVTARSYFADKLKGRNNLQQKKSLTISAASMTEDIIPVQFGLILKNGETFSKTISLSNEFKEYFIKLDELKKSPIALLPRPHPAYIAYWKNIGDDEGTFEIDDIESIQISFGEDITKENQNRKWGVVVEKVVLK